MPIRQTTFKLKNSTIPSRPLPASLAQGEAIVNTADGILYFSGNSSSTNNWIAAPTNASFFEVGSNIYNQQIRNQITSYSGVSNLTGLFLSGSSSGFVLAPISSIMGVDTYVTAFTYSNNVATIFQNIGQPPLSILINTMTGLTVNGNLSVTGSSTLGTANVTTLNATGGTITTLNSTNFTATTGTIPTLSSTTFTATTANIGSLIGVANISATSITATNANITNLTATTVSATTYLNLPLDIRVTGGTSSNTAHTYTFTNNTGGTFTVVGLTDISITGGTYNAGTATFTNNTGGTFTVTGFTSTDTYVSAFTYNNNLLTIKQTQGQPDLSVLVNTMTGLTVNGVFSAITGNIGTINTPQIFATGGTINTLNTTTLGASAGTITNLSTTTLGATGGTITTLASTTINATNVNVTSALTPTYMTANRFVFTNSGGTMVTGNAIFDGTNATLPANGSLTVGTGGLVVGSGGSEGIPGTGDVVINGSLTVFGAAVSAFTSHLYVEDNDIRLNFNPSASTAASSVCAGIFIQDGSGISGSNVTFVIEPMNGFSGITAGQVPIITEYSGANGYANRAWVTQLNDIVIRSNQSTCTGTPNGVRVLAEFDVLDGGTY